MELNLVKDTSDPNGSKVVTKCRFISSLPVRQFNYPLAILFRGT